jgi:hypothetical protein
VFFDKEQTVKRDQGWVCGCVDSLEKKNQVYEGTHAKF